MRKKQDQRQYHRNLYEGRKLKGICTGCGKKPPKTGRFQCDGCLQISVNVQRKMLYGVTPEKHDEQVKTQRHCAICKQIFDSEHLPYRDHDHECCAGRKSCGKCMRELLCRQCNWYVGQVESHLGPSLQYIARWKRIHGRDWKYLGKENA
jgi:hypothetical protein